MEGWVDRRIDGSMVGLLDGWMGECMVGWKADRWMDAWMHGWTDVFQSDRDVTSSFNQYFIILMSTYSP